MDASRMACPSSRIVNSRSRLRFAGSVSSSCCLTVPDAAGHALAARLMPEEFGDARKGVAEIGRVVEHHDHAGAERRVGGPGAFERQRHVER